MKEKVCCIFDTDESYAVRLTDYINDKSILPYKSMAFTSLQALRDCIRDYDVELVLAGEGFEADAVFDACNVIRLVANKDEACENCVFRYQPTDQLLRDVLGFMPNLSTRYKSLGNSAQIYGVYSPAGCCYKTTLALGMACNLAKKGRCLFISFEQFSGLEGILSDKRGGLSDALYYYHTGGENALGKILSCADECHGFQYFYPVISAEDISDFSPEDMLSFVHMLADCGNFDSLILDIDCIVNRPWKLLELCDKIFMPNPVDYMGKQKCDEFEKYILLSGRKEIMDNLQKIRIPYEERYAGNGISFSYAEGNTMQMIAGRFLNG